MHHGAIGAHHGGGIGRHGGGGGHHGHHRRGHHGHGGGGYWPGYMPAPVYVSACPEIYDPVIGTDGRTYANSCYANQAGVAVAGRAPRNFPATRQFYGEDPGGVPRTALTTREKLGLAAVTLGVVGLSYATYRAYSSPSPRRSLGLGGTDEYHRKQAAEAEDRALWNADKALKALRENRCGSALVSFNALNYNDGIATAHRNSYGERGHQPQVTLAVMKVGTALRRRCSIKGKKPWKMPKR